MRTSHVMKMRLLLIVVSAFLLDFTFAAALKERDAPETVYLANCSGKELSHSEIDYYGAGKDSQNGATPDDVCAFAGNGFEHWESGSISCKFHRTGTTFTAKLQIDAQGLPDFAAAGTGHNGYHGFTCFKDNSRTLYKYSSGTCISVYYCLPVRIMYVDIGVCF